MKAEFTVYGQKEGIDALTYPTTCYLGPLKSAGKKSFATAVSPVQNKEMICSDRSSSCNESTLPLRLSRMSDLVSTTNAKDCSPYWNEVCQEMSSHLWLPTVTDLQDLESNSLSGFSTGMVENSWFSAKLHFPQKKNLPETYLLSFMSSPVASMVSENTKMKSRKIRVYPKAGQRQILRQWMGVSRYVYNETIAYLKGAGTRANWIEIKKWLLPNLPDWAKEIPYQIKAIAIKDACETVKRCKALFRKTKQFHETAFRSKHATKQTIYIPKAALKPEHGVYHTLLGNLKSYECYPIPQGDCRLTLENGRWFVSVPIATDVRAENQGRIVAIDPGVRTFATFYSPESCGKIGAGDFSRIQRLCHHLDALISKISKSCRKQRYKLKKAAARMRWKIKDLIDELHHKATLFLVRNFDVIYIPKFETSQMSKRGQRKIRAKSVRSMLTFAHFRFQEFLKFKAVECGKQVIHVNEAYTSKTCSWNGKIKEIGGTKCIKDGNIVVDRDYNGARGIFLRALRDSALPCLI